MTEGTTRLLETPEHRPPLGSNIGEYPGALAQPTTRLPPQTNPTGHSLETNPRPKPWALIGLIVTSSVALILAFVLITMRNRPATNIPTPVVTGPGKVVVSPPAPPSVPPPPPPRGVGQTRVFSSDLLYPGAETTMEITDASEGNVIQLRTSDSFDKVVSWYTERLKPAKMIKRGSSNAVIDGGETQAVINEAGNGTDILLHQGDDVD